jgi:lysozyme family protein
VRGDDLPLGVDLSIFGYGVHSGRGTVREGCAARCWRQGDGVLGTAETLPAIRRMPPEDFIKAHCARRIGLLKSLAIWKTFGKGLANRVAAVEAAALAMVLTKSELEREANNAKATGNAQAGGAATVGAGGTAGTITDHGTTLPIGLVIAAVVIVVGILIIRTVINRKRADALAAAAQEA